MAFNKRSSSLNMQTSLATENSQPAADDSILLDLVNAKTAEAVAKQELEEVKGKLDALKKIVSGQASSPSGILRAATIETSNLPPPNESKGHSATPKSSISGSAGGFFSGWGKRAATASPA